MTERVEETLNRLYYHYHDHKCNSNFNTGPEASSSSKASNEMDFDDNEDDTLKFLASQFAKHLESEESVESKSEVARYLLESCEKPSDSFDILIWWKMNCQKYPILSQIARDVLAMPISTVASESAFSTSGRLLDPFRSSLSPKMVEALICGQDWLRSKPIPIDV
uniref:HAT C-terminal dimerisation domain-containing protein n=1 Tax=Nelumbo nucifera TaxID=4432 RepID=A0A822XZW2_NELNU|nr:TPA_asm: hypothetical protein HUJ06_025799 [Nelumbo nucifera]